MTVELTRKEKRAEEVSRFEDVCRDITLKAIERYKDRTAVAYCGKKYRELFHDHPSFRSVK